MSLVGDGGGEENLCHVRSGGCSVTHSPSGGWGERRISVMYVVGDIFRDLMSSHFPTVNTLYVFTNN